MLLEPLAGKLLVSGGLEKVTSDVGKWLIRNTRKHLDFILLDIDRLLHGFAMNKNRSHVENEDEDEDDCDGWS